jgi:hypothetical protein
VPNEWPSAITIGAPAQKRMRGSPVTSGLSLKCGSAPASPTTKTCSGAAIACEQKADRGGFLRAQADPGLEPVPFAVDQRDQCDRGVANLRREQHDAFTPGCRRSGAAPMHASKDIVDNPVNSKDHTVLVAAVKAAWLVETLKSPGPFTVRLGARKPCC